MSNTPLEPVLAAPFFPRIYAAHARLLHSLTPKQWDLPTVCTGWSVKDVALHMLSVDAGWLSGGRDHFHEPLNLNIDGWESLVAFINVRNESWVAATRRLSPRLLIELVPFFGGMLVDYINTLDPFEPGPSINWASDDAAPMWMQIGRELTERWTHHQQICDAVGATSLREADLVHAVLSMFVRAFPRTYRDVSAPDGTAITLTITGAGGGTWSLLRETGRWQLYGAVETQPAASVSLSTETAWRLFTKGITPEAGRAQSVIAGDLSLAEPVLNMVSILA